MSSAKRQRVFSVHCLQGVVGHTVCACQRIESLGSTMTDSARLQFLAVYYRAQADACYQMAQQASERFSQDWLDLAEKWIKLARHAEAGTFPTAGTMP
jgi:hypothetical protein